MSKRREGRIGVGVEPDRGTPRTVGGGENNKDDLATGRACEGHSRYERRHLVGAEREDIIVGTYRRFGAHGSRPMTTARARARVARGSQILLAKKAFAKSSKLVRVQSKRPYSDKNEPEAEIGARFLTGWQSTWRHIGALRATNRAEPRIGELPTRALGW